MPTRSSLTPAYSYDERVRRYRADATGRFVKGEAIRAACEQVAAASSERMAGLAEGLRARQIDLPTWQRAMEAEIKQAHLAAGAAARGGWAQMSQADYGFVGSQIKAQYQYLRNFASEIQSGKQPLDGRLVTRARMYGQASRQTYEAMRRRIEGNAGMTEERRVLGVAEHCPDCLEWARRGWQPLGTLPRIGASVCRTNCHCHFEYRGSQ